MLTLLDQFGRVSSGRKRDKGVFKEPSHIEAQGCAGGQPATLVHSQIVGLADDSGWRQRLVSNRIRNAPPSGSVKNVRSAGWVRGAGALLGLGVAVISLWPAFSQVEAAVTLPDDPAVRDEFRSQMIMPLALGADSGRRMGATSLVRPLTDVPERPSIQLTATLGQGDGLGRVLSRAGMGQGDIARINDLVRNVLPVDRITPGTQFDITLGRRPEAGAARTLESMKFRARFDLDVTIARQDGVLTLQPHPIAVDETPLRIRGEVGSSLYRSARNAGAPVSAIQSYLQAIDRHLSLENDLRAGDSFDMVVAYKRSAKGEREVGQLLYAGLERGGKPQLQLLRWGKDGSMVAASALTTASQSRALGAPVAGRITSGFGMRRHPILGFMRRHAGVDYGARHGAPIYAVADGVVSFAGRHGGHGNFVRLDHGGGNGSGYAHMSRIAVNRGARVRAGQVIGYVGSTGLSTGPHLHFEAYRGGRAVNPAGLRLASRPQVDKRELAAFKQRLSNVLAVRPGAALASIAPAPAVSEHEAHREIDRLAAHRDTVPSTPSVVRRLAVIEDSRQRN